MSTVVARPSSRLWLPLLVLIAVPLAGAAVWYWPSEWAYSQRVITVLALGAGAIAVLAFWTLFLAQGPRWLRVGAVVLALAGGAVCIREVHFSGDMVPIFTFRWDKTHDDLLEEHRRQQAATSAPAQDASAHTANAMSFEGFFGNSRDGVVTDFALRNDWVAEPPQKLWRQPVGGGYAGFAVYATRAVTIEQRRKNEAVVCYEVNTGKELWAQSYPEHFKESLGGPGPRATPTLFLRAAASPHVVTLGATGKLMSFDLETGQPDWPAAVDVLKDNANLPWGMAASPLTIQNGPTTEVIVAPGVQADGAKGRAVIVYEAITGKELRAFGNHRGAYSSPVIRKLCGVEQLLVLDGDGLTGYDPQAGKELWHHPWVAMPPQYINVAQPLVLDGDRVFISSGYDVGCAMLNIKKDDKPEVLWQNKLMRCKFTSPVQHSGYLYGLDEGILVCLDTKTGERKWKGGRYGHGQVLLVGKHVLVLSESGDLVLVEATPEGHRELAKFAALEGKTWNPPALSQGLVFVRNHNDMACYQLPGEKAEP
jgi:outer membrane protein assembly factor BamB